MNEDGDRIELSGQKWDKKLNYIITHCLPRKVLYTYHSSCSVRFYLVDCGWELLRGGPS